MTVMAAELVDAARNKDGTKPESLRLASDNLYPVLDKSKFNLKRTY